MWSYPFTPPYLSHPHSQSPEVSVWACWRGLSLAALTPAPSDPSGWTKCRLRSGTYRLFAALVATKKPIPAAIVLYLFKIFFFFLSSSSLKMRSRCYSEGYTGSLCFGSYFHLLACLLASCQALVPLARQRFPCFFFLSSTSCPCVFSHTIYLYFGNWGLDFFFQ